jgi:hypothetical protein
VTTSQVLLGVGLILALAAGSQVLASLLKIPAIIILLPAGFVAGAITTDVNPQQLLGSAFQPLVSLAVAVILYDAGMSLDLRKLRGHTRRIVVRLIVLGVPVTLAFGAIFAGLLLDMSPQAALIIGVLFVSISATVTPASVRHLVLPTLGLVAVLVLIARPLVALLATARTDMTTGERWFTGWMAPRGIVAASTASTFSAGLVARHVQGAAKILPVTFLVIVVTVAVYGLTAAPVARRLGVTRPARTRPLLVGGEDWVVDLGRALRSLGLEVLMWAGLEEQRQRITQAGLDLAPGELLASATGRGAQLEGITAVLFLTAEDDFNALGSTVLQGNVDGAVYRLGARRPSHGVVAPYTGGEILFNSQLTRYELGRRYADGARIRTQAADGRAADGRAAADANLLFVVRADGRLAPVTRSGPPESQAGDTMVMLGHA